MAKKESKPKVHEELDGLSFEVDEFGEIKSNYKIDKINQFLNKNVDDKKFKERDDLNEIKGADSEEWFDFWKNSRSPFSINQVFITVLLD